MKKHFHLSLALALFLTIFIATSAQGLVSIENLTAYWDMENDCNAINETLGTGLNFTSSGTVAQVTGWNGAGKACRFGGGSAETKQAKATLNISAPFTFIGFINKSCGDNKAAFTMSASSEGWGHLFAYKSGGIEQFFSTADNVGYNIASGATIRGTITRWECFAITFNGTNLTTYINATPGWSNGSMTTTMYNYGNISLAKSQGVSTCDMVMFDNIAFFKRGLSAAEVSDYCINGSLAFPTSEAVEIAQVYYLPSYNETQQIYFNLTVEYSGNITNGNSTATLLFNNTYYNSTNFYVSANKTLFSVFINTWLIYSNVSNHPFNWSYNYTDGSGNKKTGGTTPVLTIMTQTYKPTITYSSGYIETQPGNIFINYSSPNYSYAIPSVHAQVWYNDTGSMLNVSSFNYSIPQSLINSTGINATKNFYVNLTVTYGGITSIRSINGTQFFYKMTLTNCSVTTNNLTLNVSIRDEESDAPVNSNLDMLFNIYSYDSSKKRNYSFSQSGVNNSLFCIYPKNATYYLESLIDYEGAGYDARSYETGSLMINSTPRFLDLYLLGNGNRTIVIAKVTDQYDNPLEGAYVKVMRYYPELNTDKTIQMGKTNYFGETPLLLIKYTVWYKFIVEYEGQERLVTATSHVTQSDITFILQQGATALSEINGLSGISGKLSYNNDTGYFTFIWSDISHLTTTGCLKVIAISSGSQELTDTCLPTTSGQINYQLDVNLSGQYMATAYMIQSNGQLVTVDSKTAILNNQRFHAVKRSGTIAAFLIVATITLTALFSLVLSIILMFAGLVFMTVWGFLPIPYSGLVILGIICFIIAYKVKK